jgi:hypothetical protein
MFVVAGLRPRTVAIALQAGTIGLITKDSTHQQAYSLRTRTELVVSGKACRTSSAYDVIVHGKQDNKREA